MMFNVLFQARRNIFNLRGGDTVQLENTMKYLTKIGVNVTFDYSYNINCSKFDIIHLFNITSPEDTFMQLRNAKRQNKLVCISPIYWNMEKLENENDKYIANASYISNILKSIKCSLKCFLNYGLNNKIIVEYINNRSNIKIIQKEILKDVDLILPNSVTEWNIIKNDLLFNINKKKSVVYNGYDGNIFNCNNVNRDWGKNNKINKFVLCVGRIEPRKNQLMLFKALKNTDIIVVCVGRHTNKKYSLKIIEHMKPTDIIIEEIDHEKLKYIYAATKVHILPSFYDTPGLVSLEAGAMGCNIVTSKIGSQEEYFADMVDYCDPYDEESIRRCVYNAMERDWPNENIMQHISNRYRWDISAKQTFQAYENMVS